MGQKSPIRRIAAALAILSILFSGFWLSSCGGETARAATIHLAKSEGSVEVADDSMENLLILGAYTFRDAPGYGFTGYVWNGDGVDRIPFDKTEFIRADFRRNPVPDGRTLRAFRFRFLSGTI
ncbi:MAG: hypothetical protein HFI64_07085 [Lachnospiraceae bacterium]|nr:hypothetical protein [Lachnospiraceae bacterium]